MADDSLLAAKYSMLTQGFIVAGVDQMAQKSSAAIALGNLGGSVGTTPVGTAGAPLSPDAVTFLPNTETPVIAGFMASEVAQPWHLNHSIGIFPPAGTRAIHGGHHPLAAVGVIEFKGDGTLDGFAVAMFGGKPVVKQGPDMYFPDTKQFTVVTGRSKYHVYPDGTTARARIEFKDDKGNPHVLYYFMTILANADELHFVVTGASGSTVQSGVMKRCYSGK